MERPEFGLVGSLSRLVDEERACGGVEQGLLHGDARTKTHGPRGTLPLEPVPGITSP